MRSVFTFLPVCSREEVDVFLEALVEGGSIPRFKENVYLSYYDDLESEDPELHSAITDRLGNDVTCMTADISGRIEGTEQATAFCIHLLERFGGVAHDDYSEHLWTLEELRERATYMGHHFFDHVGWYLDRFSTSAASLEREAGVYDSGDKQGMKPVSTEDVTITYQSNLNDIAEPVVRHALRGETARRQKIWSPIRGAIWCGAAAIFVYRNHPPAIVATAWAVGALVGGCLNSFTYDASIIRRIRKHMERETQGRLPATTICRFEEQKLVCDYLGATIAFPLSEVKRIAEDNERLEICFGSIGLSTIPLRAFDTLEQKHAFIARLSSGQKEAAGFSPPSSTIK